MTSTPISTLRQLLTDARVRSHQGSLDVPIRRIRSDSREVEPGDVFVCLPGYRTAGGETRADRHLFIPQAVERGAVALVVEREPPCAVPAHVPVVRVTDAWAAIAAMARAHYRDPSRELLLVGVTGTSGKTSTTYFIESVLEAAGQHTARLGTIDYKLPSGRRAAMQTTPEAPVLQCLLRQAVETGATAAVIEVSSHALELRRAAGIAYDVGVFTNLSQDHLNFHPDMDHYLRAKGRLFAALAGSGKNAVAVVNESDAAAPYIKSVNRGALLTYGVQCAADVTAASIRVSPHGVRFSTRTPVGEVEVRLAHRARYAACNALAALATGVALHVPLEQICAGLASAPQIPGRFEVITSEQPFLVVVDYAHKPGALEQVLQSARALRPRRLITVFGCGGDRDRSKRPVMGAVAARYSDRVVITSDNPRTEDPAAIVAEIAAGVPPSAKGAVSLELDRRRAIASGIAQARAGDLVLIAGKGHEPYQILGTERLPFDDRTVARELLSEAGRLTTRE